MSNNLQIEKGDTVIAFAQLHRIALQHYVGARINLAAELTDPGALLGHQSIEIFLKAIGSLHHQRKTSHDLVDLIEWAKAYAPTLGEFLKEVDTVDFLNNLTRAYKWHRYGESKSAINALEVAKLLDDVIYKLRIVYALVLGAGAASLYVPESVEGLFLRNNTRFTKKDITSNPMASIGLPGMPNF